MRSLSKKGMIKGITCGSKTWLANEPQGISRAGPLLIFGCTTACAVWSIRICEMNLFASCLFTIVQSEVDDTT